MFDDSSSSTKYITLKERDGGSCGKCKIQVSDEWIELETYYSFSGSIYAMFDDCTLSLKRISSGTYQLRLEDEGETSTFSVTYKDCRLKGGGFISGSGWDTITKATTTFSKGLKEYSVESGCRNSVITYSQVINDG